MSTGEAHGQVVCSAMAMGVMFVAGVKHTVVVRWGRCRGDNLPGYGCRAGVFVPSASIMLDKSSSNKLHNAIIHSAQRFQ